MTKNIIYIGLGSNVGNRLESLNRAWSLLQKGLGKIITSSSVYETLPWGIREQRNFYNAIIGIETEIQDPYTILAQLKGIEKKIGRIQRVRNGPREIDLDIILHGSKVINEDKLQIPHPRAAQRAFVVTPLLEAIAQLRESHDSTFVQRWLEDHVDPHLKNQQPQKLLVPLDSDEKEKNWIANERTLVMGIINATPDSFSDGGHLSSVQSAIDFGLRLVDQGADILDLGGESTRPGAKIPNIQIELDRVLPIIQALRTKIPSIPLSIDTRRAQVAKEAANAGVSIINDVSGGRFDPNLLSMLAQDFPALIYIATHSRGDPTNMNQLTHYEHDKVALTAAQELVDTTLQPAMNFGIAPWRLITDPGLGFAKNIQQNFELMRNISTFKHHALNLPLLVGPSRKSFIGHALQQDSRQTVPPHLRDWATAGACCALIPSADIVRVHNVRGVKDALLLADAISRR